MTTQVLETPEVNLVYDVHGPLPAADGRPPLVMIGQPMDASGFGTLASHFPDRTVVTYDPRGLGRSTRKDGRVDHAPRIQAADVHAIIKALAAGPVGEEFLGTFTGRTSVATAKLLGQQPMVSRATTAASSATSSATRGSPKPSRASCARSSTMPADGRHFSSSHGVGLITQRSNTAAHQPRPNAAA
jgi:pimeloyl-ACP methyl ester carboxylesterase